MLKSYLPAGGGNLFQEIKEQCALAEKGGQKRLLKLSIGQPVGPALLTARLAASSAMLSEEESMHEYQDNGSPGIEHFARRFVNCHIRAKSPLPPNIECLPIPGIKPMLGVVQLACGLGRHGLNCDKGVMMMTNPGYPTPKDQARYLGINCFELSLNGANEFRWDGFGDWKGGNTGLFMLNYPHNPSGQIATEAWLRNLCTWATENRIRIFNDAAYSILAHDAEHTTLTDVALDFPELSWAEAFSASKAGNFTGWRVGAMIGSSDFIGDIKTIKGNTDSGFSAFSALGVLHTFENHMGQIDTYKWAYSKRLKALMKTLTSRGMKLAVVPGGGFFTLWLAPRMAFGKKMGSGQDFNYIMIEKTGIVGVHFGPYIRYAVVEDVLPLMDEIDAAFKAADVSY